MLKLNKAPIYYHLSVYSKTVVQIVSIYLIIWVGMGVLMLWLNILKCIFTPDAVVLNFIAFTVYSYIFVACAVTVGSLLCYN
jgi:hypothetical protein